MVAMVYMAYRVKRVTLDCLVCQDPREILVRPGLSDPKAKKVTPDQLVSKVHLVAMEFLVLKVNPVKSDLEVLKEIAELRVSSVLQARRETAALPVY